MQVGGDSQSQVCCQWIYSGETIKHFLVTAFGIFHSQLFDVSAFGKLYTSNWDILNIFCYLSLNLSLLIHHFCCENLKLVSSLTHFKSVCPFVCCAMAWDPEPQQALFTNWRNSSSIQLFHWIQRLNVFLLYLCLVCSELQFSPDHGVLSLRLRLNDSQVPLMFWCSRYKLYMFSLCA